MSELKLDLNELVSDHVQNEIISLKDQVRKLQKKNTKLDANTRHVEISMRKLEESTSSLSIVLNWVRAKYITLKEEKDRDGKVSVHLVRVRYLFICGLMQDLLDEIGITKKASLPYRSSHKSMILTLAVNYHHCKDKLTALLNVLGFNQDDINAINIHKMPWHWSNDEVKSFIERKPGCTNGVYFGPSQHWIGYGAGMKNATYDFVLKNPLAVSDELFPLIIKGVKSKYNGTKLLVVASCNEMIHDNQIKELGEALLGYNKKQLMDDVVVKFVKKQIHLLSTEVINHLLQLCSIKQYHAYNYNLFPVQYQKTFLKSLDISTMLKEVASDRCKWDDEEKSSFLMDALSKKSK